MFISIPNSQVIQTSVLAVLLLLLAEVTFLCNLTGIELLAVPFHLIQWKEFMLILQIKCFGYVFFKITFVVELWQGENGLEFVASLQCHNFYL